jgi:hypothetical protein
VTDPEDIRRVGEELRSHRRFSADTQHIVYVRQADSRNMVIVENVDGSNPDVMYQRKRMQASFVPKQDQISSLKGKMLLFLSNRIERVFYFSHSCHARCSPLTGSRCCVIAQSRQALISGSG